MSFEEDMSVFLDADDFADTVIYSHDSIHIETDVIIDKDVELVGELGQVVEKVTTIELPSSVETNIGGEFNFKNGDSYIIDAPISDDGSIQTVSVVKQ